MWSTGKKLATVARLWALGQIQATEDDAQDPHAPSHQDQALAALGLVAEGELPQSETPCVHLWPENAPVFALWQACQTQWHYVSTSGPMGAGTARRTGLNYPGVDLLMRNCARLLGLRPKDHSTNFALLQAMEIAALKAWAENTED